MNAKLCSHFLGLEEIKPADKYYCEECVKTNSTWLHLRVCQTCGKVHCCDDSPNRHATKHYHATNHPVITSAEPGEQWLWCFPDQEFAAY